MKNLKYILATIVILSMFGSYASTVFAGPPDLDLGQGLGEGVQNPGSSADDLRLDTGNLPINNQDGGAGPNLDLNEGFSQVGQVKPAVIKCPPGLPCITTETQAKGGKSVRDYVLQVFGGNILKWMLGIIGITCVVFIIIGGLQMLLALGTEEDINKAKKTLLWAIVGLVISILSVAIVQIVTNLNF